MQDLENDASTRRAGNLENAGPNYVSSATAGQQKVN